MSPEWFLILIFTREPLGQFLALAFATGTWGGPLVSPQLTAPSETSESSSLSKFLVLLLYIQSTAGRVMALLLCPSFALVFKYSGHFIFLFLCQRRRRE